MHRAHRRNSMSDKLSANMLYNYVKCPHRLTMDLFGDYSKQDPISAFVKLLWEKGTDFEKQVVKGLEIPFLDLSSYSGIEKEKRTKDRFLLHFYHIFRNSSMSNIETPKDARDKELSPGTYGC